MNNRIKRSETTNLIRMSEVLADLQKRGFSYLFELKDDCISCEDYSIAFEEFDILEVHSMENISGRERYDLYAVKSDKFNIKGVIVKQFGTYSDGFSNICISKILNNTETRLNIIAAYA